MNIMQELKDLKRRFNILRKQYEIYEEYNHNVKKFKGYITQSGGAEAPTFSIYCGIQENTVGNMTFSYADVGSYRLKLPFYSPTNEKKVFIYNNRVSIVNGGDQSVFVSITHENILLDSYICINVMDIVELSNCELSTSDFSLCFEVYP